MPTTSPSPSGRTYVLALLTLLSAVTFMDRQILAVLLQPIKHEFGFSDLQIGLITGLGFALAFGVLGLPLGRLADRYERRSLIAWCRGVGGCIAATAALAGGVGLLTASRAGAALGDAGGGAASMSMLSDLYAPHERSRVMSLFGVGSSIGALMALVIGPWLAQQWGWRVTLATIGLAAVVGAVLLRWSVREPVRQHLQAGAPAPASPAVGRSAIALIWAEPVTRWLIVGGAFTLIAGMSLGAWNTALMVRRYDFSLQQAGWVSAMAALMAVTGSLCSGWLADKLAQRDVRWQVGVPVLGVACAAVFALTYLLLDNDWVWLSLACMWIYSFFSPWWAAPTYAALSLVVPSTRRATASAMLLMAGALLGNGLGPILCGWFSDVLHPLTGGQGLRYAMLLMVCMLLPGLWAFVQALGHYPRAYRLAQPATPVPVVPAETVGTAKAMG